MNTKITNQKNGGNDSDRTGACGTNSTFNFVVGIIAVIVAIVIGYISYTRFF